MSRCDGEQHDSQNVIASDSTRRKSILQPLARSRNYLIEHERGKVEVTANDFLVLVVEIETYHHLAIAGCERAERENYAVLDPLRVGEVYLLVTG